VSARPRACPVCNGEPSAAGGGGLAWVECHSCELSGPISKKKREAVSSWNRLRCAPVRARRCEVKKSGETVICRMCKHFAEVEGWKKSGHCQVPVPRWSDRGMGGVDSRPVAVAANHDLADTPCVCWEERAK
jgi:hypothetical protein